MSDQHVPARTHAEAVRVGLPVMCPAPSRRLPDPLAPDELEAADRDAARRAVCGRGVVDLVIYGEPASKANSRRLVSFGDRPAIVKSTKALRYERDALRQIPAHLRLRLEGPVRVTLRIFYASERPDLDESVVLDVLQDRWSKGKSGQGRELVQAGVIRNDRQVREKHVHHGIDKANPRAEIRVEALTPQQQEIA